jgi:hypothetical protein
MPAQTSTDGFGTKKQLGARLTCEEVREAIVRHQHADAGSLFKCDGSTINKEALVGLAKRPTLIAAMRKREGAAALPIAPARKTTPRKASSKRRVSARKTSVKKATPKKARLSASRKAAFKPREIPAYGTKETCVAQLKRALDASERADVDELLRFAKQFYDVVQRGNAVGNNSPIYRFAESKGVAQSSMLGFIMWTDKLSDAYKTMTAGFADFSDRPFDMKLCKKTLDEIRTGEKWIGSYMK